VFGCVGGSPTWQEWARIGSDMQGVFLVGRLPTEEQAPLVSCLLSGTGWAGRPGGALRQHTCSTANYTQQHISSYAIAVDRSIHGTQVAIGTRGYVQAWPRNGNQCDACNTMAGPAAGTGGAEGEAAHGGDNGGACCVG
jgi:hypothetical protein